jgi:deazaflavin-dependent oxidoreductase (nitroreductase family)
MSQQETSANWTFFNRIMKTLLRSPLHGVVSRTIMLITFTGRKSGQIYTTPVSYTRKDGLITAFTHARWYRNLAGGVPVTLYIKRKEYPGVANVVVDDKQAITDELGEFLNLVRTDARIYKVKFDENGYPNRQDVESAAQDCVMIRIRLDG